MHKFKDTDAPKLPHSQKSSCYRFSHIVTPPLLAFFRFDCWYLDYIDAASFWCHIELEASCLSLMIYKDIGRSTEMTRRWGRPWLLRRHLVASSFSMMMVCFTPPCSRLCLPRRSLPLFLFSRQHISRASLISWPRLSPMVGLSDFHFHSLTCIDLIHKEFLLRRSLHYCFHYKVAGNFSISLLISKFLVSIYLRYFHIILYRKSYRRLSLSQSKVFVFSDYYSRRHTLFSVII